MKVRGRKKEWRGGEEKLGCYVYCWQFTHAHSICDPISCQIGKAMGMWKRQESQQGLNLVHHWDLIKTQSCSLPEQAHTSAHSLHSLPHPSKRPSHSFYFSTQTPLNKCTHNHGLHSLKNINLHSHVGTHTHSVPCNHTLAYFKLSTAPS